jgi:hypothetical protein
MPWLQKMPQVFREHGQFAGAKINTRFIYLALRKSGGASAFLDR